MRRLRFLIIPLLAVSCAPRQEWQTATRLYFDTLCEIRLFCSRKDLSRALHSTDEIFGEVERLFSPDSMVWDNPRVVSLFQRADEIREISDGAFDIGVAPLSRAWGFHDKNYRIPAPKELEAVLLHVGMSRVRKEVDRLLPEPGAGLDWGGIAKGYGIDWLAGRLIEDGFEAGFVNAGGDLFCWGWNPEGLDWKVGIQRPRGSGFLGILSMTDSAAATTGDYQRFFEKDGIRYHHVFDPATGYPARGRQSVTVVGPEALLCDALSTALFVFPNPDRILERFPEYGAVLIDSNGRISMAGKTLNFRRIAGETIPQNNRSPQKRGPE